MGRIRCPHCQRKVDDGFDYCPSCGMRLPHDAPPPERRGGSGAYAAVIVTLCLLIIAGATCATVWLIREKDREDASRELVRHRRDSLKAAEIGRLRKMREIEDSLHFVAEMEAERRRIESQMLTVDELVTPGDADIGLRRPESAIRALRERGYSTLRRESGGRCTVMGLNAEMRGGKLSGKGDVWSAAGIWQDRVEVVFGTDAHARQFMADARRRGFTATADTAVMVHPSNNSLRLRLLSPRICELTER